MSIETFKKELEELMQKHNVMIEINDQWGYDGEEEYVCGEDVYFQIGTERIRIEELNDKFLIR